MVDDAWSEIFRRNFEYRMPILALRKRWQPALLNVLVLLCGWVLGIGAAVADQTVPSLSARVTDLTSTLSSEQMGVLEKRLAQMEAEKGSQFAILLVPTTEPETIEQYSLRVVERWKLGRKGVDDGVLLLLAMEDRAMRIEVGYGLEGALTDALSSRIIREILTPELRAGRPFEAISGAVDAIEKVLRGEELPPPIAGRNSQNSSESDPIGFILILPFILGSVLRNLLGRPIAGVATFGVAAAVGAVMGYLMFGALVGLVAGLFVAFGSSVSGGRGRGSSWGGGSSSSGGGFSGGGGSFGGGGASGRW